MRGGIHLKETKEGESIYYSFDDILTRYPDFKEVVRHKSKREKRTKKEERQRQEILRLSEAIEEEKQCMQDRIQVKQHEIQKACLLYTSPSPRD